MKITAERVRALFCYDQASGVLAWRTTPFLNRVKPGDEAGSARPDGYRHVRVDKKLYLTHRLAWLYVTGEWPNYEIDHIDMDRGNNRWVNLRDATSSNNKQNARRARRDNQLGILGVCRSGPRFRAHIGTQYLGTFESATLAHEAYLTAKRKLHPGGML